MRKKQTVDLGNIASTIPIITLFFLIMAMVYFPDVDYYHFRYSGQTALFKTNRPSIIVEIGQDEEERETYERVARLYKYKLVKTEFKKDLMFDNYILYFEREK